jgi:hypothetical protein
LSQEDRIPNGRCSGVFEVERREIESTLANAMHQLDACNRVAMRLNRLKTGMTFV